MKRSEAAFTLVACVAGVIFFASLGRIWPQARVDLEVDRDWLVTNARQFLTEQGFDMTGFRGQSRLQVDERVLDYLEKHLEQEAIQTMIQSPLTLVRYQVFFKKRGEVRMYSVALHPDGAPLAWSSSWLEEAPGAVLTSEEAAALGIRAVSRGLEIDLNTWDQRSVEAHDLQHRRRHSFVWERNVSQNPLLREQMTVIIEGDVVAGAVRSLIVPEAARLEARAARAPLKTLETIGFLALGIAGLGAIWVFLLQLQAGRVRLVAAAGVAAFAFFCGMANQFLQKATLFLEWDPLWPQAVSLLQSMMYRSGENVMILLLVLVMVAAGDAIDRQSGSERGRTFWKLARGGIFDSEVGRDCRRGFLLGLICGAVLSIAGYLPLLLEGSYVAIQPRGFFFYAINASSPALATLLFFLGIALIEETGYRFFGGGWLLQITGRPWPAILIPGLIYGLTHTGLDFLPPAEPFWARPLILTLVGCVWGWGFLRFGALTVVISHFTADLFIFNQPRLAGGEPHLVAIAVATIAVPLIPVFTAWVYGVSTSRSTKNEG